MILQCEHLSKSYVTGDGVLPVLKDVSLGVEEGELVSIMGPSGCGKSTLLNILGTLDKPDSGKLTIQGKDGLSASDEELSKIRNNFLGFVFQFHHLLPEFSVIENIMLPQMLTGQSYEEAYKRSVELLRKVGLEKRKNHRPGAISGGERQRVAVLRALANSPRLVLADEPTGNLDMETGSQLMEFIVTLSRELARTFIIATHNPEVAAKCTRHLILEEGRLNPR